MRVSRRRNVEGVVGQFMPCDFGIGKLQGHRADYLAMLPPLKDRVIGRYGTVGNSVHNILPPTTWPEWLALQPMPDPRQPTPAPPGTIEKLWVMALRVATGLPAFLPEDAKGFEAVEEQPDDLDVSDRVLKLYLSGRVSRSESVYEGVPRGRGRDHLIERQGGY